MLDPKNIKMAVTPTHRYIKSNGWMLVGLVVPSLEAQSEHELKCEVDGVTTIQG